jgi:preprotein translocase subunit SecB
VQDVEKENAAFSQNRRRFMSTVLSPLQMKDHRFTNLRVKSLEFGSIAAKPSLKPTIWFEQVADTTNQWRLILTLLIASADPAKAFAYEAEVQLQGLVEALEDLPSEKRQQIALVNGFSILYSAAREMLLIVTARSAHGPMSLPTISFVEMVKQATKPAEKPAEEATKAAAPQAEPASPA